MQPISNRPIGCRHQDFDMLAPSLDDARSRALVAIMRFRHGLARASRQPVAAGHEVEAGGAQRATSPRCRAAASQVVEGHLYRVTIRVGKDKECYPLRFDVHKRTKGQMPHLSSHLRYLSRSASGMLLGSYPVDLSLGLCTDGLRLVPTSPLSPIDHMVGIGRGQSALAQVMWGV